MNATAALAPSLAPLRALLAAVDAKATALCDEMHPAWVAAVRRGAGLDTAGPSLRMTERRQSVLMARAYGLRWPPLTDFALPLHRLAVLGRRPICQVLALFALRLRCDGVRRIVGRQARAGLIGHIGQAAYGWLLEQPAAGRPGPPIDTAGLDLDRLASAGCSVLGARGAWHSRAALAIIRLSLAPDAEPLPGHGTAFDAESRSATDAVADRIPTLFPELAWLFGSDMDRALSVWKTASCEPPTSPR